jgi:hypothetical protein
MNNLSFQAGRPRRGAAITGLTSFARLALCLAPLLLGGCDLAGAVAYKTFGPAKVPAQYQPAQEPMLVLVENYGHSNLQPDADELAAVIASELTEHKVAPIVDEGALTQFRTNRGPRYASMKIPEVGQAVGARQVLYVDVEECQTNEVPGSDTLQGKLRAKVKVVDVETGRTRWPQNQDSLTVAKNKEYVRKTGPESEAELRRGMLEEAGFQIARMFYSYKPLEQGPG